MSKSRRDHEPPLATEAWGWKYHHLGIPTDKVIPGEQYIPRFKVFVSGFSSSPFGIEWMRFEIGSPVNRLIQTVPHIAFEVQDLDKELRLNDFKVISAPSQNTENIRVAMIEHNGAPVELIEFSTGKS